MRSIRLWGKKQKNCDPSNPADYFKGDQWDHTAIDVDSRLIVSMVPGKRGTPNVRRVVDDFAERTNHVLPQIITTDDCSTYENVLLDEYGEEVIAEKSSNEELHHHPTKQWPEGKVYATVNKSFEKGAVSTAKVKIVFGSEEELERALSNSENSKKVNTSFIERQNGTDRGYNARKVRKTYKFSKELIVHIAISWWILLCYNYHHINRGLDIRMEDERKIIHRTPAMAAGLANHQMASLELATTQVVGFKAPRFARLSNFQMKHERVVPPN